MPFRIVLLALLLSGVAFTGSPAQAQVPAPLFIPGQTPTQAFPWCYQTTFLLPYCPSPMLPTCSQPIPCQYFGQQASTCAEWRCEYPRDVIRLRPGLRTQ
jgi:hypothetical protein